MGASATLGHYLLLMTLVELFLWPATLSAFLGALGGAAIAYYGNWRYTFQSSRAHRVALPRFFLTAALGSVTNAAIVWGVIDQLELHYLLAQMLATITVVLITFHVNRKWTFPTLTLRT